jgi:Permuted papain-like amidase enzyme, YaeF/YiiX, C92 family
VGYHPSRGAARDRASPMKSPVPSRPDGPSESYSAARESFVEGDLLCFRGRGLVSATIRLLTRSAYSHVGLVHLFEGRVYCLEAVASGVRLCLMSELVKRYAGGIDYFEVLDVSPEQRRGAVGFGFQQLGKPFDYRGLARFFLRLVFRLRLRTRPDERFFCAELVAQAYANQHVRLASAPLSYTSPSGLIAGGRVHFRARVKA